MQNSGSDSSCGIKYYSKCSSTLMPELNTIRILQLAGLWRPTQLLNNGVNWSSESTTHYVFSSGRHYSMGQRYFPSRKQHMGKGLIPTPTGLDLSIFTIYLTLIWRNLKRQKIRLWIFYSKLSNFTICGLNSRIPQPDILAGEFQVLKVHVLNLSNLQSTV